MVAITGLLHKSDLAVECDAGQVPDVGQRERPVGAFCDPFQACHGQAGTDPLATKPGPDHEASQIPSLGRNRAW